MACHRLIKPIMSSMSRISAPLLRRTFYVGCMNRFHAQPLYGTTIKVGRLANAMSASQSLFHASSTLRNEHIINIQDAADFAARVIKNTTPVIVDFHATWCGPCKLLGPRLESLVASKKGKVILAKIDIDDMTDIAVEHGVEAVPTVFAMRNGKVVDKFVGLKDDADLESFIQRLIH